MSRLQIPAEWKKENPGKHRLGIYGQNRADGWHCWGCRWQYSNARISREHAETLHAESLRE